MALDDDALLVHHDRLIDTMLDHEPRQQFDLRLRVGARVVGIRFDLFERPRLHSLNRLHHSHLRMWAGTSEIGPLMSIGYSFQRGLSPHTCRTTWPPTTGTMQLPMMVHVSPLVSRRSIR